ncbi:MAG: sigma-54-dependent Fis family transcriptional regulator, partial [Gammaproteobacteria bacterium]|nr:sigma-54-dependent Fis family transcriptional regulator [Gammaproteobacteria bacterium]
WPGNVRELKNVVERCLLLNVLPSGCLGGSPVTEPVGDDLILPEDDEGGFSLAAVEKRHVIKVLEQESGNKSAAARLLGISRKTLERKAKVWGVT